MEIRAHNKLGAGNWSEQQKLVGSAVTSTAYFAHSVAMRGNKALIGAYLEDNTGSAYVFTRDGSGIWCEQAQLVASDSSVHDYFGGSVAFGRDIALIGATGTDDNGVNSGSAYVFDFRPGMLAAPVLTN